MAWGTRETHLAKRTRSERLCISLLTRTNVGILSEVDVIVRKEGVRKEGEHGCMTNRTPESAADRLALHTFRPRRLAISLPDDRISLRGQPRCVSSMPCFREW